MNVFAVERDPVATPAPTSPLIGKGVSLGAALDIHGSPRGAATDIGTVQHQPGRFRAREPAWAH